MSGVGDEDMLRYVAVLGLFLVACSREVAPASPPSTSPSTSPSISTSISTSPSISTPAPTSTSTQTQTLTPPSTPIRAVALFSHPEWIGQHVRVDLYEPMWDDNHSTAAPNGGYDIEVSGVGATRLGLIPAARGVMPGEVHPPLRVSAVLRKAPHGLLLAADKLEPLTFPKPERLAHARDVLRVDAGATETERYVEVEDETLAGFEASLIGEDVWLSFYPDAKVRCAPPRRKDVYGVTRGRAHVVGYAHTGGPGYGHLGMRHAEIIATEVTYIDPKRADCR